MRRMIMGSASHGPGGQRGNLRGLAHGNIITTLFDRRIIGIPDEPKP